MSDQWDLADRLETIVEMLQYGGSTQWHDAIACQAWLELVRQRQISPKRIPTALDTLADLCLQATWFPVWALAIRALTYYDDRQKLAGILPTLRTTVLERKSRGLAWSGLALVLVEAQLECGTAKDDDLLRDLDPQDCLPLGFSGGEFMEALATRRTTLAAKP